MPKLIGAPRLTARAGLTLAELLVVLVLFGIVGTALVKTMTKQQQFFSDQTNLIDARRELRLGANTMPMDLRSVSSSGSDIKSIAEDRIDMLAPIGSSIICARIGTTVFIIPPENLANNVLTAWSSEPVIGDSVFLYNENLLKGSEDDQWERFQIVDIDKSAQCSPSPYMDTALDPPATKPRYRYTVSAAIPDSVKIGAVVRFVRPVRYRLEALGSSGRSYLTMAEYRNNTWQASEQVAGPYRPFLSGDGNPSGLQFRYFDTTGTRLATTAPTINVGRIDVYMRADRGQARMTGRTNSLLQDSVLMRIGVRNSK